MWMPWRIRCPVKSNSGPHDYTSPDAWARDSIARLGTVSVPANNNHHILSFCIVGRGILRDNTLHSSATSYPHLVSAIIVTIRRRRCFVPHILYSCVVRGCLTRKEARALRLRGCGGKKGQCLRAQFAARFTSAAHVALRAIGWKHAPRGPPRRSGGFSRNSEKHAKKVSWPRART